MKTTNAPKPTEQRVTGAVDPTNIARGVLRTPAGGVHGGKGRQQDNLRKEMERRRDEVAPPGWEGTVKAMKKHKDIDNPWALAWSMKKKGYKSHKPEHNKKKRKKMNEGFPTFSEWLQNNHADIYDESWRNILLAGLAGAGLGAGHEVRQTDSPEAPPYVQKLSLPTRAAQTGTVLGLNAAALAAALQKKRKHDGKNQISNFLDQFR